MPFFWIVLVFLGEQTFKMLHKSRWNVKVYVTLTIMTFRSIFKVTWRSRRFFRLNCARINIINWTLRFWRKSRQTHLLRIVKGPLTWTIGERWLGNKTKNVASTGWCSATFCTHRTWVFKLQFQWEIDCTRRSIRMVPLLTRSNITWFPFMGLY